MRVQARGRGNGNGLDSKQGVTQVEAIMTNTIARFVRDESGATAIEYGLIAAGISVAIITIVYTLGSTLSGVFTSVNTKLTSGG
jgi:pilus assembly protein Flp/PilA